MTVETTAQGRELAQQKANDVDRFIRNTTVEKIENEATFNFVADAAKKARKVAKEIETARRSITDPMNEALRATNALFKPPVEKLEQYERGMKGLMLSYQREQDRIRLEAQRKAEEEARKQRERIEAEARKKREEQERAAREAEEAMRKAQAAKDEEERQRLTREADEKLVRAETASVEAEAQEAVGKTVVAPVVPAVPPAAKKGVYGVTTYKAVVIDKKAFVRWALASNMLEYITVQDSLLTQEAKATKGARKWPGVRVDVGQSARMRA